MNKKLLIWIIGLFLLVGLAQATLTDNIRYYYSMDDADVSGTTLIDSSGTANATMDAGIGTFAGVIGEARALSLNEKFDITDLSYSSGQAFTINTWLYGDTDSGGAYAICGTIANNDYIARYTDAFHMYPGGGTYVMESSTPENGKWYMVTFQRHANNTLMAFENGILAVTPVDNTGTYDLQLCGEHYNGVIDLQGKLDEFGIWDRALTPTEITELYNSGAGLNPYTVAPTFTPAITETYSPTASEQNTENFSIRLENFNITAAASSILVYNNTNYIGTITHLNNNNVTFDFSVTIPQVYDPSENVSFYFLTNLTYANGTLEQNLTTSKNQAVLWNLTLNPRVNITATSLLNASPISSFSVSNGTIYSTISDFIYLIGSGTDEFSIDAANHAIKVKNINWTSGSLTAVNYLLYTTNSFNLTFRDLDTGALITGNISIDIIGDTNALRYNTSNSTLYIDLLIPEHYTFRYSASGYNTNQYEYDLTNRTHNILTFYLDNATDLVTVSVYDSTSLNLIPNAKVYLQKFDVDSGAFNTVSIYSTDPSGNAYFYVEKGTEYYKFSVDYPDGIRKLDTEKFYINSDTINLYISLVAEVAENFFSEESIDYTLIWSAASRSFIVNYVDSQAVANEYCLYIKEFGHYGATTHNSTCITSSAGSIDLQPPAANSTYYATFTAKIESEERILSVIFAELGEDKLNAGVFGIFLTVVLIMIFAFMGTINIMALFFASAALAFAKLLGIISLGWGEVIAVFIVSLIISLVLHFKK